MRTPVVLAIACFGLFEICRTAKDEADPPKEEITLQNTDNSRPPTSSYIAPPLQQVPIPVLDEFPKATVAIDEPALSLAVCHKKRSPILEPEDQRPLKVPRRQYAYSEEKDPCGAPSPPIQLECLEASLGQALEHPSLTELPSMTEEDSMPADVVYTEHPLEAAARRLLILFKQTHTLLAIAESLYKRRASTAIDQADLDAAGLCPAHARLLMIHSAALQLLTRINEAVLLCNATASDSTINFALLLRGCDLFLQYVEPVLELELDVFEHLPSSLALYALTCMSAFCGHLANSPDYFASQEMASRLPMFLKLVEAATQGAVHHAVGPSIAVKPVTVVEPRSSSYVDTSSASVPSEAHHSNLRRNRDTVGPPSPRIQFVDDPQLELLKKRIASCKSSLLAYRCQLRPLSKASTFEAIVLHCIDSFLLMFKQSPVYSSPKKLTAFFHFTQLVRLFMHFNAIGGDDRVHKVLHHLQAIEDLGPLHFAESEITSFVLKHSSVLETSTSH